MNNTRSGLCSLINRCMNVVLPLPYRLFHTNAFVSSFMNLRTVVSNTLCPSFIVSYLFLVFRNGVSMSILLYEFPSPSTSIKACCSLLVFFYISGLLSFVRYLNVLAVYLFSLNWDHVLFTVIMFELIACLV